MSDRKQALQDLLAKVEAGVDLIQPWFFQDAFNNHNHKNCAGEAFTSYHDGSLDAAKALHEAVFPDEGWEVYRTAKYPGMIPGSRPELYKAIIGWGPVVSGRSSTPARAWLIAILKALIAQEGET